MQAGPPPPEQEEASDESGEECDVLDSCREHSLIVGCCSCCCILFLVTIIFSLGTVPPLHYGITVNQINKNADTETVYGPGRHLISPFKSFILFPASIKTIEFTDRSTIRTQGNRQSSLHTRTKDGLAVQMHVSMQYQLAAAEVGQLYRDLSWNYETVFVSTARDVLTKAASSFEGVQFWANREDMKNSMKDMLGRSLSPLHAVVYDVQFLEIDLPATLESRLEATEVQKLDRQYNTHLQKQLTITAKTHVIKAEFDRKMKVVRSTGEANCTMITKVAQANAMGKVIDAQSAAMSLVKSRLGMSADSLVDYQKFAAIDEMGDSTLFYGFSDAPQVFMR
eukprot:TRINITY_DN51652_c0_g1_i1.p1 TRINITY_DN51652_c0_g1~~TRINITY_DN51652_c0_g1_i1.p1  ORF type:complete len:369 (-),score=61.19 TRINITY_DN51652_c0_g1_i1:168-1181(-)